MEPLRGWLGTCVRDPDARPSRLDVALVIGLLLGGVAELLFASDCGCHTVWTWLFLPALVVPLAWHRRYAVIGLIGTLGALAPLLGITLTFSAVFAILVAVWSAAAYGDRTEARWVAVGTTVAMVVVTAGLLQHGASATDVIANVVLFGTAWVVGDNVRQRRERTDALEARAALLEREREERVARAAADERARIARDLHDIVAHTVSVMVVQAGAARRIAPQDPARAHQALGEIERTGRDALNELRRILGVLRDGSGDDAAPHAPQPGVDALPELVRQLRDAGVEAQLHVQGRTRQTSPGADVCIYRVAQEALTNVVKHAGRARVDVTVTYTDDHVTLEVRDDGRGAASTLAGAGGGMGLLGMRERIELFGGELHTGPLPTGGFIVRARVPRRSEARPAPEPAAAR